MACPRFRGMKGFALLLIAVLTVQNARGQDVPVPGAQQPQPIILQGGTIHTGSGGLIANGDILLIDGKIVDVGKIRTRVDSARIIDCSGKHIYPGLIAPATQIGLDEVEAVRATEDRREVGAINPNARAIIAYNADSRVTPTLRSNGILMAQVSPEGELFAGTSSVVKLDAWNWEDAAYVMDDAIHLYWPRLKFHESRWMPPIEEQKKKSRENLARIDKTLNDARGYWNIKKEGKLKKVDLRWEALIPVLERKKPLFIHANDEKQIRSALEFAIRHDVRMVLVGGADAWLLADLLASHKIPVVLRKPHNLPKQSYDDIDMSYKMPKVLKDAGILVCLSMRDFWNQRNLPFQAGTAAAYGLTKEEALSMITLNTAKILGIGDRTGSIEPGKDATLLISTGDLLDMRTSKVRMAFIQGREVDLGNKQKDLYQKFKGKYGMD